MLTLFGDDGLLQEAFNIRAGNHLVADGIGRAHFAAFQEPMNGDITYAQNLRRLAHGESEPGQGMVFAVWFCDVVAAFWLASTRPVLVLAASIMQQNYRG